jgi:predicted nicotinamide N-methyase
MDQVKTNMTTLPATELITFKVGDHHLDIERVVDLDSYLDQVADQADKNEDLIPYWSELWPSSIALSEYIVEMQADFKDKRILELGCGTGMLASVFAILDLNFLATDFEPLALDLTRKNIFRNTGKHIEAKFLDWRKPDLNEKFDIIVAADVIYETRSMGPLIDVFTSLLNTQGTIYLAEPNRSVAKPFITKLRSRGFSIVPISRTVIINGDVKKITINKMV